MHRRRFVKAATVAPLAALPLPAHRAAQRYFEFRAYHLPSREARPRMHAFLADVLVPALNRHGVAPVGVFAEQEPSDEPVVYVLLPFASAEDALGLHARLEADSAYTDACRARSSEAPLYTRFDASLLEAFASMPELAPPPKEAGLFELRVYESRDDEAGARKVAMFNEGEMPIFDATGLNRMFFGQALSGPSLPNLTYMLWFTDAAAREQSWAAFFQHPDWIAMKDLPQYANTVSKVVSTFLVRAPSSQL